MTNYEKRKDAARQEAIEWQAEFSEHDYSYGEIAEQQAYFEQLARKYGLVREFKENGII
jgi:hypothetical protein